MALRAGDGEVSNETNGNGTVKTLIAIIVLLIGSHYGTLVYRLNKAEDDLVRMQREFASAAIAAAVASANASNAAVALAAAQSATAAAAAAALVKK